jgi:hypothetical protein
MYVRGRLPVAVVGIPSWHVRELLRLPSQFLRNFKPT